jgi:hypothetical protein
MDSLPRERRPGRGGATDNPKHHDHSTPSLSDHQAVCSILDRILADAIAGVGDAELASWLGSLGRADPPVLFEFGDRLCALGVRRTEIHPLVDELVGLRS